MAEKKTSHTLTRRGEPFVGESIGKPTPPEEREHEPQPRLRQEDARNVPQRSATATGSAHPVEAGEPQPQPRQEDFQDVPQRSATPLGAATPILPRPVTQEEAENLRQRSATRLGVAEPKPAGDPVHQALTRDASVKRAASDPDHTKPEPAGKVSEQKARAPRSKPKKATAAGSVTRTAQKKDPKVRAAVRKQATDQSKNKGE